MKVLVQNFAFLEHNFLTAKNLKKGKQLFLALQPTTSRPPPFHVFTLQTRKKRRNRHNTVPGLG